MWACSTELWLETLHHHLRGLLVNLVAIISAALILQTDAPPWFNNWAIASLVLTAVRFVFYLHCKQVQALIEYIFNISIITSNYLFFNLGLDRV